MTKKFVQKLRMRKNGLKKDLFGLFLSCELFSVSCRLRLQIYELFNELTSWSGTYNKRRIITAKTMKKLDSKPPKNSSKAGLKSQTQQENTTNMKVWKITTAKFKCTREHFLSHDWLTKGAFVWDQSGIRIIGIMQVSVCLGAILIPEYLDSILAILLLGAE